MQLVGACDVGNVGAVHTGAHKELRRQPHVPSRRQIHSYAYTISTERY